MANMYWRGGSTAVAQVDTFTPGGTIEIGDIFILTVTGENGNTTTVTFTAAATTAANVAAGLVAAWNASTHYLCTGITASGTVTVILTADTAGVPFYVVGTTTETGGGAADDQTFTRAATTANSGPYDWNTQANWSGGDGDLPGADASDVVYVENGTIKYGLNQAGITVLTALYVTKSQIGVDALGNITTAYLQIKASKAEINYNNDPGIATYLSPINIDFGSTQTAITVYNSGAASTLPLVNVKGTHASNVIYVIAGYVGIANNAGEVSTFTTINVLGGACYIGDGATLTTVLCRAGATTLRSACTTLTLDAGTVKTDGAGAITTVNINGGTATLNSTGTITALNVVTGTADMTKTTAARTVTTAKVDIGGVIKYDPAVVTMTNKIQPYASSGNITLTGTA